MKLYRVVRDIVTRDKGGIFRDVTKVSVTERDIVTRDTGGGVEASVDG